MVNFDLNQMIVYITDRDVIAKVKEYVANDDELQKDIASALFDHFLGTDGIWNPVDGWFNDQPDRILLYIPLTVYPKRNPSVPETVISTSTNDDDFQ
jgi:hypothetical protein